MSGELLSSLLAPRRASRSSARSSAVTAPADLIRLAEAAQRRCDWREAHRLWRQVTERQPRAFGAWVQLGNMLNELQRYDDAIAAFERAAKLDRRGVDAPAGIAGVHERAGRWGDALTAWTSVIELLDATGEPERLAHALLHAAMSANHAGQPREAEAYLAQLARQQPESEHAVRHMLLRAQVLKHSDPEAALLLLAEHRACFPDDPANAFETASILLELRRPEAGLEALQPGMASRPDDLSFLWLAADLNERQSRWADVVSLSERMMLLDPRQDRFVRRAFAAAVRLGDLVSARRLACTLGRTGVLDLVHGLIEPYRGDGQLDRARLLCRWLIRRWPHSRWHVTEYVLFTATSRSLEEADRLARADVQRHGRSHDMMRAYAKSAFLAGSYLETVRRLQFLLDHHPEDEESAVLLGYALANASGIVEAERHFTSLASRSFQSRNALVGLAHMAMRRRDRHATLERWMRVAGIHPDDEGARVELARSAYELRDFDRVRQVCGQRLAEAPADATMGEFHVWFLMAIGCNEEAWDRLWTLRRHSTGWTLVELLVQAASRLGRLDQQLSEILALLPQSTTREASRRLYGLVRQLCLAERLDLLIGFVSRIAVHPQHLAWLWPYLREPSFPVALPSGQPLPADDGWQPLADGGRRIETAWHGVHRLVRGDLAERIRTATDQDISAILERPRRAPPVHIVNKFEQERGGSELHALDIADRLAVHTRVQLWAPEMPHPHFSEQHGVQAIEPAQGRVPHGGVLVLIGVYFDIAGWIAHARPSRVIFLYNTFEAPLAFRRVQEVFDRCGVRTEFLFCSDMMAAEIGLPGLFEPSPTDLDLFSPRSAPRPPGHRFNLGRHSRDVTEKHHLEDWRVYQAVAEAGGVSMVLGGTCMQAAFSPIPGLDLLPARSEDMAGFLQGLDCYYYRTSSWVEPWGRVVIEAMACGLPVVASRNGGYAQVIRHGENGLLFDTTDQAVELVRQVAADPALRTRLGKQARMTAEALLGDAAMRRLASFYLIE